MGAVVTICVAEEMVRNSGFNHQKIVVTDFLCPSRRDK